METHADMISSHSVAPPNARSGVSQPMRGLGVYAVYAVALLVSISIWFLAIGSPLWLDEAADYWIIHKGLWQIAGRLGPLASPIYPYILWFVTRLTGTSEIGMRIPSVLAMLGAAYVFYLCARRLFQREMALVATIIFCVNPIVIYASVDVRPYAFLVLATNVAILVLLRLRESDSLWLAGLFGFLCALIVYFHFLGAAVLPALLLCFILWKRREGKIFWQQLGIGLAVFVLAFLPLVPKILAMFRTADTYVYMASPGWLLLLGVFSPGVLALALFVGLLTATVVKYREARRYISGWQIELCLPLALIPVFILFGVSKDTSVHMFVSRHLITAVPGISIFWALALSLLPSRAVRIAFCLVLVGFTAGMYFASPAARRLGPSWKHAIAVAEKNASRDNATVLICSGYVETNYGDMPLHSAKESRYFASLSYYKLTVPVVPLPKALNAEAKRVGASFLSKATRKHQRFLAIGSSASYKTLDWLKEQAAGRYSVRTLGIYDGMKVMEFDPLPAAAASKRGEGRAGGLILQALAVSSL